MTVAAIIERKGRFLLVEEQTSKGLQLNQPAGHLEEGESLLEAVRRETYEETGWQFEPEALLGIQLWRKNINKPSFLRFCFTGSCHSHNPDHPLDVGITATHWLTQSEIELTPSRLRSPLVAIAVTDYLAGRRYPLSLLQSLLDV